MRHQKCVAKIFYLACAHSLPSSSVFQCLIYFFAFRKINVTLVVMVPISGGRWRDWRETCFSTSLSRLSLSMLTRASRVIATFGCSSLIFIIARSAESWSFDQTLHGAVVCRNPFSWDSAGSSVKQLNFVLMCSCAGPVGPGNSLLPLESTQHA